MADTSALKTEVERFVRGRLADDFPGHTFSERAIQLRKKRDGTLAVHKFDAVSEDNSIIASIKAHSWKTRGGNIPSGKIDAIFHSLYFLSLVSAKTKLLILTDKRTYDGFVKGSDGKVVEGIEIRLYELPRELQRVVEEVQRKASQEMSQE